MGLSRIVFCKNYLCTLVERCFVTQRCSYYSCSRIVERRIAEIVIWEQIEQILQELNTNFVFLKEKYEIGVQLLKRWVAVRHEYARSNLEKISIR